MKKIFTLIAAMTMAFSVNAQEQLGLDFSGWPWNYETTSVNTIGGTPTITCNSQWGEYKLITKSYALSEYKGYKLEFSDAVGEAGNFFQVKIENASGAGQYNNLDPAATVLEGEFNPDNFGTDQVITTFNLQGMAVGAKVTLQKVYIIKNDGTEEATAFGGKAWGVDVTGEDSYPAQCPILINFTGQFGGVPFKTLDGKATAHAKADITETNSYKYTVELNQPISGKMMIEYDNASGGGFAWNHFEAGASTLVFYVTPATFEYDEEDEETGEIKHVSNPDIAKIYIKAAAENDNDNGDGYTTPIVVDIKSITREVVNASEATAIKGVETKAVETNNVMYNLAGQQVSKSYKGIVIMNGKKFINK